MGIKFPTEIVPISAEIFTEIGLSARKWYTFMGIRKFVEICLMYTEGFDQVDGSTTRAATKEISARREICHLGLHQRVSGLCARERMRIRRLLL